MVTTHAGNLAVGRLNLAQSDNTTWNARLDLEHADIALISEHQVHGIPMLPGALHVEFANQMLLLAGENAPASTSDLQFHQPVLATDPQSLWLRLAKEADDWRYACYPSDGGVFDLSSCYASLTFAAYRSEAELQFSITQELNETATLISAMQLYQGLHAVGNHYGVGFRAICDIQVDLSAGIAIAELDVNRTKLPHAGLDPMMIDAAVQALSALVGRRQSAYVLSGIEKISCPTASDSATTLLLRRTHLSQDNKELTGDAIARSADGEVLAVLQGIRIGFLTEDTVDQGQQKVASCVESCAVDPPTSICVAATFTAEPLQESIVNWGELMGTPFDVQFAPYNQVFQQLLDPSSLFFHPADSGQNVILLRFEDWIRGNRGAMLQVSEAEKAELLDEQNVRRLPRGLEVAQVNSYETDYVYKEIFVDRCYMKHGIELNDGDLVVDIGANIGLFSLFVQQECRNSKVLCFDPSPPVFEALRRNASLYGGDSITAFNCGISDADGEATFTYYEKSSVFSSFHADADDDEAAIREVVVNMLSDGGVESADDLDGFVDELMADRMNSTPYTCPLRSLSSMIREQGIPRIDLLKIDAEKSELKVLQGIDDEHWPIIKQLVIEVHDREGSRIEAVRQLLKERGFEFAIEEETLLQNSGLYNIFATRTAGEVSPVRTKDPSASLARTAEEFKAALLDAARRKPSPWIVAICPSSPQASMELGDKFAELEADLSETFSNAGNVSMVRSSQVEQRYPVVDYHDPHGDQLGHVPFTQEYFTALGTFLVRRMDAIRRIPRKVIVLDCDNTLWKGQVGEDGPQHIDPSGPFAALQRFMVEQHDAGMLICLCSKNSDEDVLAAFASHSAMPLQMSHIVSRRVNWQPKSQNLIELAAELNVGLESFVFIDDNPVECAEVTASLPQVLTLQLPMDSDDIHEFLRHVWALDQLRVTEEDRKRTAMYQQSIAREQFRETTMTLSDFLAGLQLEVQIAAPREDQMLRLAQLTQRANQFNFTTIRRQETELRAALVDGLEALSVSVRDRFGDYGLVGEVLFRVNEAVIEIDTFLLSCRVLGRGVEHRMLAKLGEIASARNVGFIDAEFQPTSKNLPALQFLEVVGAQYRRSHVDSYAFSFPAEYARNVQYRPEEQLADATTSSGAATNGSTLIGKNSRVPYQWIALECRTTERIQNQLSKSRHVERRSIDESFVAPKAGLQRAIAEIWREVLGVDRVGVKDNFRDLGGTSLKAVQLIVRLKKDLGHDLAIVDLFEHPTVSSLTQKFEQQGTAANDAAKDRGARRRENRRVRRRRK